MVQITATTRFFYMITWNMGKINECVKNPIKNPQSRANVAAYFLSAISFRYFTCFCSIAHLHMGMKSGKKTLLESFIQGLKSKVKSCVSVIDLLSGKFQTELWKALH